MTSVDPYIGRVYHRAKYNCLHFARDVWADLTGVDISVRLAGLFEPGRKPERRHLQAFTKIKTPQDPCLVLFTRRGDAHIGVYLRGRVLHLPEEGSTFQLLEIASLGFSTIGFYV